MLALPDKLVVVGMRFVENSSEVIKRMQPGADVALRAVENNHGVDGRAWEVMHRGRLIGYIRNQDVDTLPKAPYRLITGYIITGYTAEVFRQHYIVLRRQPTPTVSQPAVTTLSDLPTTMVGATIPHKLVSEANIYTNNHSKPKMNTQNLKNQIFREVKNVALDIQTGKLGIQNAEGIATYQDGVVSVNPIVDFGVKVPAFAMRVPIADLNAGDIIIQGDTAHFFHQHTDQGYEVVSLSGEIKQVGSVTNLFFGANTVLAVKNMFGSSNMNPLMMAMMLDEDKEGFDMKTFALMSMMGNQTGDQSNMQQMMMMAMLMNK